MSEAKTEQTYDLKSLSKIIEKETERPEPEEVSAPEEITTEEDNDDEILVVEDDSDEEESNSEDEEVSEKTKPQKGFKRDKRIEKVLKQKTAMEKEKDSEIAGLKSQIYELSRKENERSTKETDHELQILDQKTKEAFDSSNYEEFKKYQDQANNLRQSNMDSQMTQEDMARYFKSNNPWYEIDKAKTYAAQGIHKEILNDDGYRHLNPKQQLDLVTRQVDSMPEFKKNPYQNSSPTEGAPMERPSKKTIKITRSELNHVRMMFPGLGEKELLERTKELANAVNNQEQ
jgi:hypothetical protein